MNEKIRVTVKLFAQYRENKFKVQEFTYPAGSTAGDVIVNTGIDTGKYPLGILMANGRHIKEDYILKNGDVIAIFPKVGGG